MQDYEDLRLDRDLQDRLILVENSLLMLKAKSRYFADWDNSEVERLERLRSSLRGRYERSRAVRRNFTTPSVVKPEERAEYEDPPTAVMPEPSPEKSAPARRRTEADS